MKNGIPPALAVLLCAAPAYACGMTRSEAALLLALALPILLLGLSPLALLLLDALRAPFGLQIGLRGGLLRALLGAGGSAIGFWGGAFGRGQAQLGFLVYGLACAALLSYGASIVHARVGRARSAPFI